MQNWHSMRNAHYSCLLHCNSVFFFLRGPVKKKMKKKTFFFCSIIIVHFFFLNLFQYRISSRMVCFPFRTVLKEKRATRPLFREGNVLPTI